MSHELATINGEVAFFSAKRVIPWHGLGTVTEDVLTAREAIVTAGLDWAVRKQPIYIEDPAWTGKEVRKWVAIPDKYATVRLTDGMVLGCGLGPDYEPFQNVEAFDLFDTIVDDGSAKYETAGALYDGKVIFILARLSRDMLVAGDKLVPYLLLLSSHDGSTALRMLTTPVRVVCHEEGTLIQDGLWRGRVEDHPSVDVPRVCSGLEVEIAGIPFTERVTPEHRYWAKQRKVVINRKGQPRREVGHPVGPGWVEAKDLLTDCHEIGLPIDMTEHPAPSIEVVRYVGGGVTAKRLWSVERDPRLDDPEWWWLCGYWWGNGHIHGYDHEGITCSVPLDHPEYIDRISDIYRSAGWTGVPMVREGCVQMTLYDRTLATMLETWIVDHEVKGQKVPPVWVESLPLDLQRALIRGYFDADGDKNTPDGAIITSVSLNGLLAARRILARLGIPSSIRKSSPGGIGSIQGRQVMTQPSWTIRFWRNTEQLGIVHRFKGRFSVPYIEDGHLWSRVRAVRPVDKAKFWPITTATEDYLTAFGQSHNCANTLRLAVGNYESSWSVRHTQNMKGRVDEARKALQLTWQYYDEFEKEVAVLMDQHVTSAQVDDTLAKVFPKKGTDVLAEKALAVRGLYETSSTIAGFKDTAWGLLNAVSEWELWASPTRAEEKRLERQAREIVSGIASPLMRKTHILLKEMAGR